MQQITTIVFLTFYLVFNLGLGLNFHFCEKGKTEISVFYSQKQKKEHCHHHSSSHSSSHSESPNCEDVFILLVFSNEQVFLNKGKQDIKPELLNVFQNDLHNRSHQIVNKNFDINIIKPPPKSGKNRILANQQFIFYA